MHVQGNDLMEGGKSMGEGVGLVHTPKGDMAHKVRWPFNCTLRTRSGLSGLLTSR